MTCYNRMSRQKDDMNTIHWYSCAFSPCKMTGERYLPGANSSMPRAYKLKVCVVCKVKYIFLSILKYIFLIFNISTLKININLIIFQPNILLKYCKNLSKYCSGGSVNFPE